VKAKVKAQAPTVLEGRPTNKVYVLYRWLHSQILELGLLLVKVRPTLRTRS
jgi:hypothetical protein